jgi:hypothetical protein
MKAKEVFGLMLRFFGLVCVYQGLDKVPAAAAAVLPQFPHLSLGFLFVWFLSVAWPLAIGIYLVRGAPSVVRFAYGPD